MIISRTISLLFRASELAFSVIVAGITGWYLHATDQYSAWSRGRYIYTVVVAGLSILVSLVLLIPFTASLMHWPLDLLLFVLWMVAFGLLEDYLEPLNCGISDIRYWRGGPGRDEADEYCSKFQANVAFCFLAGIFFLASALLGLWVVHRKRKALSAKTQTV